MKEKNVEHHIKTNKL